ncbi:creatinase-like isoform X4 [Panulirus ornatus]|uniref:creatinase-like isoform X4 n=1 Tax=Panulirus ornatus TaxID=150431 RepID=UPI003A8504D4
MSMWCGRLLRAAGRGVQASWSRAASNDVATFRDINTMKFCNGQKMPTGLFTAGEVEGRITKLRETMEHEGIAACLFTSFHNINYYSGGFVYCAFNRPYCLIVTPEKHVIVSSLVDGGQPWRRSPHNSMATAEVGGWACTEVLGEGVPEYEVALAGTQAMVRNIAKIYPNSDLMDSWVWFQSGINTDGSHNPVTSRKIQKGDNLSLNCFSTPQGYNVSLERTCFLDHCSDAHLKVWEANVSVHKKGLQLIQPGAKCSEIAHELSDMYAQLGLLKYQMTGCGHSLDVLCHRYGLEAAGLALHEDSDTVLEPGMVVSMKPMITIPEGQPGAGGYREHSILIINDDNTVENITSFPFGPEHNIIKK